MSSYEKGLVEVGDGLYAYLQPDGGWGFSGSDVFLCKIECRGRHPASRSVNAWRISSSPELSSNPCEILPLKTTAL